MESYEICATRVEEPAWFAAILGDTKGGKEKSLPALKQGNAVAKSTVISQEKTSTDYVSHARENNKRNR